MIAQYLTATLALQILLQSTADVVDCRSDGEQCGIIQNWMSRDEAIAVVLVWRVTSEYEQKLSPKVMMSFLINYCRDDIANAYADFMCQVLHKDGIVTTPVQLKQQTTVSTFVDIEAFIRSGRARELGYKASWNPFREPLSTHWQTGLA